MTHTHTTVQRPFVRDYPGRPVPEETLTHSHPSWSLDILHQLPPFTTIHIILLYFWQMTHTHPFNEWQTQTHLTALFPGLPGWAGTRKVKPIWVLLKQETVSGSGISWAICKSAPCSRQITTPAPHHSVFYGPDALPAAQPTASKHWRHLSITNK